MPADRAEAVGGPGAAMLIDPLGERAGTGPRVHGTLCIWPDGILFTGGNLVNAWHRHLTASLFFSLHGRFRLRIGRQAAWRSSRGILVAPNTVQQLDARGCELAILQIDPETEAYARIASRLAHESLNELEPALVDRLAGALPLAPDRIWDLALGLLEGPPLSARRLDARVSTVLDLLKGAFLSAPTAADLAEAVGLSEGRLVHPFNEQVGIPLRRYILWLRLRHVFYFRTLGHSLTAAAHEAGFADSAHLSRTFRGMFGMPPSVLFRSARVRLLLGLPTGVLDGPHARHDSRLWASAAAALGSRNGGAGSSQSLQWVPLTFQADDPTDDHADRTPLAPAR